MYQDRKNEIFQRFKNMGLMDKYMSNREKLSNLGGVGDYIKGLKSPVPSAVLNNPATDKIGQLGQYGLNTETFKPTGELASKIGVNSIGGANNLSQASGTLSKAGNALKGAGGAVGAITGGLSAADNFSKGNAVDGALDLAKTGAMFIPGVGWAVSGAIQIGQMIKGALDKAKQKSMAKSQEEAYKSQQLAENEIDNTKQNLEQTRQNNLNNMQQQMQQPQSNEELVKDLIGQYENQGQSVPESSGQLAEGMPTGFASNIPTNNYLEENAPSLPYVGSATEALDEQSAMKQSIMDKLKSLGGAVSNGIRDFSTGYDDNSQHGFADGDLFKGLTNNEVKPSVTDEGVVTGGASELKKSIMNRLGELAGTGARVMANPWTQAGIAALATKATGGDWADSLNNAYSYGTAKATSNYYDNKLNPDKAPTALSRYTKDDYNANTLSRYRDTIADNNAKRVKADLDKNMPTLEDWYNTLLYTGEMSLDDYNNLITSPDYNPTSRINIAGYKAVNDKNYKTDSNNIKRMQVNNNYTLGKEKNDIARTNANTNAGRLTETQTHNRNTESLNAKKYDLDVDKFNAKQEENKQKSIDKGLADGTLVRMKAPDGSTAIVKSQDVAKYRKMGAKVL